MINPINNHLVIEPLRRDSFVASHTETYQEIGTVIAIDPSLEDKIGIGYKVYFDGWLAAKFPKNQDDFYWLVKWEDIRAIEKPTDHAQVPELPV